MKILQFLLILVSCSCLKQELPPKPKVDANGVVINMSPLWKNQITDKIEFCNPIIKGYIVYNNGRLFAGSKNQQSYLTLLHVETGQSIWKSAIKSCFYAFRPYQYQNYLFMQSGQDGYCFDLETGQTVWKIKRTIGFDGYYFGFETNYFLDGSHWNSNGVGESVIYVGNILTGEQRPLIYPDYSCKQACKDTLRAGKVVGFTYAVKGFNSDKYGQRYALVYFADMNQNYSNNISEFDAYVGLYNLSNETWVYKKQFVHAGLKGSGVGVLEPIILGDLVYSAGEGFVACHKIWTGEKVWSTSFINRDTFEDMLLIDGQLIVNSYAAYNSTDTRLYVLESSSGEIAWSIPIGGTSGRLVHLNGVVYFTNGNLHAIDLEARKQIWNVRPPDLDSDPKVSFSTGITAIPGKDGKKGKILVNSGLSAMAFEAAR